MRERKICCCLCHHHLMDAFDLDEKDAREIVANPELAALAKDWVESRWASEASLAAAQQAFDELRAYRRSATYR